MSTFSYCRCNLSRAYVIPNSQFGSHDLQFNITTRYIRANTSDPHPPQEIAPPTFRVQTIPIHTSCFFNRSIAFSYVKEVLEYLGLSFTMADFETLISCLLGIDVEMIGFRPIAVVASVDVVHTDLIIEDDVTMPFGFSDETMILDAMSATATGPTTTDTFGSSSGSVNVDFLDAVVTFDGLKNGAAACPICLDEFEDGCRMVSTRCSHLFHRKCIKKWIKKKTREPDCPLCRAPIR